MKTATNRYLAVRYTLWLLALLTLTTCLAQFDPTSTGSSSTETPALQMAGPQGGTGGGG